MIAFAHSPGTAAALREIRTQFEALESVIRASADAGPLDWFINPGNWGDSLIREGTQQFLRRIGVNATPVAGVGHGNGNGLLFGGGGRCCRTFPTALPDLVNAQRRYQRVIVLPSSIELDVSPCDPDRVTFFVRERHSSQIVARCGHCPRVCPDLAFWVDVPPQPRGHGTLYSLRRGPGRHSDAVGVRGSVDLSLAGDHHSPLPPLLAALRPFARVVTDRLHIAIPSAMLGKRTICLEGDYFKLRGAYEAHLRLFANVEFWTWDRFRKERSSPMTI